MSDETKKPDAKKAQPLADWMESVAAFVEKINNDPKAKAAYEKIRAETVGQKPKEPEPVVFSEKTKKILREQAARPFTVWTCYFLMRRFGAPKYVAYGHMLIFAQLIKIADKTPYEDHQAAYMELLAWMKSWEQQ